MKRNKDISDLIRENQHKLNERPSPRNWQRLESKLDNQRNQHRTSVYKQFAMVAAVVALVAVASLISITVNDHQSANKTIMAEGDFAPMSQPVHELETVYSDANEDLHKVVEFQRSLKRIYASNPNPIAEGNQNKKVVAANEDAKKNNAPTSTPTNEKLIASNKTQRRLSTPTLKKNSKTSKSKDDSNFSFDATDDVIAETSGTISAAKPVPSNGAEFNNSTSEILAVETETYSPAASVNATPPPAMIERTTEKIISPHYLGTWKYDKNLNRNEKINIIQSGNTIQLLIKTEGTKDAIYDFVSEKNNIITFVNTSSKEGYNIRIENGKYVIYKNNQDYGLLIEKEK